MIAEGVSPPVFIYQYDVVSGTRVQWLMEK